MKPVIGAAVVFALSACGTAAADDENKRVFGTREQPVVMGEPALHEEWVITLYPSRDATKEVLAFSPNIGPEEGFEYRAFAMDAVYMDAAATPAQYRELTFQFRAEDGSVYFESCGNVRDDIVNAREHFAGGRMSLFLHPHINPTAAGTWCTMVPEDAEGVWELIPFEGESIFFQDPEPAVTEAS